MTKIQNPKNFVLGISIAVVIVVTPLMLILTGLFEYYKANPFDENLLLGITMFVIFSGALLGYFTPSIKPIKKLLQETKSENGSP